MHIHLMCFPVCVCCGYGKSTYTAGVSLLCNVTNVYITINITLLVLYLKLIKFDMNAQWGCSVVVWAKTPQDKPTIYSGFEVTCPDCDLQSALDHAARDK